MSRSLFPSVSSSPPPSVSAPKRGRRWGAEDFRRASFQHRYGMPYRVKVVIHREQGGCCYLCDVEITLHRTKGKRLAHLDHDGPNTVPCNPSDVRALLCEDCNKALGIGKQLGMLAPAFLAYMDSRPHKELIERELGIIRE